MRRSFFSSLTATLLALCIATPLVAQTPWSVRVAKSVMRRSPVVLDKWDYTAGVVLLAMERLGTATGDRSYGAYIRKSVDSVVDRSGTILGYRAEEFNLDQVNEGRALFALEDATHDARYRRAIETLRDQLRHQPRTAEGGFWHKQIYPQQMWLDGLYMAEPFYAEFARRARDTAAMNDVAHQFLLIGRHLRDPKTGLFYHAWDAAHAQPWADSTTGLSKNFWGRAVGWYLMAAMDVFDYLPAMHRDRPEIERIVRDLSAAVAMVRDPVTGLWWQVLDQSNRAGNYLETSASSMFIYAFAKGTRLGILDKSYRAIADRAFTGLVAHSITVQPDGLVSVNNICKVAGLGGSPPRDGSYQYYVSEPVVSDDYKGVGPFMLAALELGR